MSKPKYKIKDDSNGKWLDASRLVINADDGTVSQSGVTGTIGGVTLVPSTGIVDKHGREAFEGDIFRIVQGKHYWLYEIRSFENYGNNLYAVCYEHNVSDDGDEFYPESTYQTVIVTDVRRDCITNIEKGTILGSVFDYKLRPTGWLYD